MIEGFIKNPGILVIGVLLIMAGGILSLKTVPVDLFPDLNYPLINIITHYPSGTALDMEQLVTVPIENAMMGARNLYRLRSVSAPGFSQVVVEFIQGTDVLQARQIVYSRLSQVRSLLPQGALTSLENIGTSLAFISTYALKGDDPARIYQWARYVMARRLAALPGVASVDVMGGGERAFRIELDPQRLLQFRISPVMIVDAIRASNVLRPGGYLEKGGRDIIVSTDGRILTIPELSNVLIKKDERGQPVTLGQLSRIYDGVKPMRYEINQDRVPAVAFTIRKQAGASTLEVSRAVDRELKKMGLPRGVRLEKFYDQAEIIGLAYRNMLHNLLAGALLAVLCLFWATGFRPSTLVLAVSFPVVVMASFSFMGIYGLGINLMTLGAITVAIGMVVDDAIIVLENIDRVGLSEQDPVRAALKGTRQLLAPDVAGTLTVLAAFVPLVLVSGLGGRLLRPFGITFSLVLCFSLIFSLTLIPAACALEPGEKKGLPGKRHADRFFFQKAVKLNLDMFKLFLKHKKVLFTGLTLLFLASIAALAFNPARFLPMLDESSLLVSYQLPPGTSLSESSRVGDRLEKIISGIAGAKSCLRRTGSPEASFYIEGTYQGEIIVRIDREKGIPIQSVKRAIANRISSLPGIITRINEPTTEKFEESFSGIPAFFGITIFGNDISKIYSSARRIEDVARKTQRIDNVINNTKIPIDQVSIHLDRNRMAKLGVIPEKAAEAVHVALQGVSASESLIRQHPVSFYVKYRKDAVSDVETIGQILVPSLSGALIPIGEVAEIKHETGYPVIRHRHGLRSVTITADITGNPGTVLRKLKRNISGLHLPHGIQWMFTGEYHELLNTLRQVLWSLLISIILVYGIMYVQLGDWLYPLIVLVKIPLDFMGAALALWLTRQDLDITVIIGFVTLAGVSTNNGIVLLTFIRKFRSQGMEMLEAVKKAIKVRTRPMLLTHATTLLALIPAIVGLEHGPQLLRPLGIMLFGGLTAGTMLTLNLLPLLYVLAERGRTKTWLIK